MRIFLNFCCCLCSTLLIKAQPPVEALNNWAARSPIEKVYLHLDRDNYVAGETIWFKAYLYSDFYPDTISTTLYAELIDGNGKVRVVKSMPVVTATARNQFEIPDSLPSGNYYIRAYSPTMLNHGEDFLFKRAVYISSKNPVVAATAPGTIQVDFFPEGGNMIADLVNTVAFKLSDENGLPIDAAVQVVSENGEVVSVANTYHAGLGKFELKPSIGKGYFLVINNKPTGRYPVPPAIKDGIAFTLKQHSQGRSYQIVLAEGSSLQPAYIVGQVQHHVAFTISLDPQKKEWKGVINTKELPSGVLQITVFNKDHMPLSERLSFIDNKEYIQQATLITDTVNFDSKSRNHFTIALKDSVAGSFSVAITDPDYSISDHRNDHIISSLLMTADLKGNVYDPAYYFTATPDSAAQAADLLMMTHGWRRFKWTELPAIAKAVAPYRDPGFISVSGTVTQRDSKRPLPDKDLFVMHNSVEDSTENAMQFMSTDAEGKFKMDSLIFFGKTRFYVSDIGGKKSKWLDIHPNSDSVNTFFGLMPLHPRTFTTPPADIIKTVSTKLAQDYESIMRAKGEMLNEVTIKVKKKTPIQELEERYTSGLFSGYSTKTIDLTNTDEKIYQNNIFDYIQGRVAGVTVQKNRSDYVLIYRNRQSISQGFIPMIIYLDEMETDARVVATIPANQIAMIKVFSSFLGGNGNASGGVLAVYTKKGNDLNSSLATSADVFMYKGYSVVKEFYSPDYAPGKPDNASSRPDERITLLWQPNIEVNSMSPRVPVIFYNNERSKRFKVIVEGMTADGRMLFLEKLITPVQGF